jgi:hypothetical protein
VVIEFAMPPLLVDPYSPEGKRARVAIRQCAQKVGHAKMRPQGVAFGIDDAFNAQSSKSSNAAALRALLDCLIDLNLIYLQRYPKTPGLYEARVFYHFMPTRAPWDTIPTLFARGYGDCKSLVAARIAELRQHGQTARPVFRHIKSAWGTMFHILLQHDNGNWECPSRILGMRTGQEIPGIL